MSTSAAKTKRIVSGMRPTGRLHLGHYFGILTNWLSFQDKYDAFYIIVDWHALTTKYQNTSEISNNILEVALDCLAVGIDPEKSTLFVQSAVPETAELHLLLSMYTPQNWVERDPTLKDMVKMLAANQEEALEKFHMACWAILYYKQQTYSDPRGNWYPFGRDQEAHLEFSRALARRFNNFFDVNYFPEPKPEFTAVPVLKGIDGQKMGKSYNNDIKLADTEDDTTRKVKQMITDRTRIAKSDPGHTDLCEVPWPMYQIFGKEMTGKVKTECESAIIGCVQCKTNLAVLINDFLKPIREKRKALANNPDQVIKILEHGNLAARKAIKQTVADVYEIMGLKHWNK